MGHDARKFGHGVIRVCPAGGRAHGVRGQRLPALIAYLDTSVRYARVNDAYSRWFGRPREEILGHHPSELLDAAAWTAVKPMKVEDGPGRKLGRSFRVKLWPNLVFLRDAAVLRQLARPTDAELQEVFAALVGTAV